MVQSIYIAKIEDLKISEVIAKTIVSCIESQSEKYNIQRFGAPDWKGRYHFNRQSGDVVVSEAEYGHASVKISGNEKQIKSTKSKLLKMVGGLQLN